MRIADPRLQELYDCLSGLAAGHAGHPHLRASEILGKNVLLADFAERHLAGEALAPPGRADLARRLLRSLRNHWRQLARHLALRRLHRRSGQRCPDGPEPELLIVTELDPAAVRAADALADPLFRGLREHLDSRGVRYRYAPLFMDAPDPQDDAAAFAVLRRDAEPVLTPFETLGPAALPAVLWFLLAYPLRVLRLGLRLLRAGGLKRQVGCHLLATLDHPVLPNYLHYLHGRALARRHPQGCSVLLWYENRAMERCLITGLRSGGHLFVIGARLFLWPDALLHMHPDPAEPGCLPHRILVNGPHFIQGPLSAIMRASPSLRYQTLDAPARSGPPEGPGLVLVLLSYFPRPALDLLRLLAGLRLEGGPRLLIKRHPSSYYDLPADLQLPQGAEFTAAPLAELLPQARVVLGSATGALAEALACGVPVVVHRGGGGPEFRYLPELGRGAAWREAASAGEVRRELEDLLRNTPEGMEQWGREYRRLLFTPPSEEGMRLLLERPAD